MSLRTVSDTLIDPGTGAGWASQTILVTCKTPYLTGSEGVTPWSTPRAITTDSVGAFTANLPVPTPDSTGSISAVADNGSGEIRCTSTAHGLTTADQVDISDFTTHSAANGLQTITVIDANTFDLDDTTYVSGTETGSWAEITSAAIYEFEFPKGATGEAARVLVSVQHGAAATTLAALMSASFTSVTASAVAATLSSYQTIIGAGTVDTISDLTTTVIPTQGNFRKRVRGYYSRGDGGEGEFIWVSGDTTTENLGTIFESTVSGYGSGEASEGRWHRVRPMKGEVQAAWFGLVYGRSISGANRTANATALQSAINLHATETAKLRLPDGAVEYDTTLYCHYDSANNTGFPGSASAPFKVNIEGVGELSRIDATNTNNYRSLLIYTGTSNALSVDRYTVRYTSGTYNGEVDFTQSGSGSLVRGIRLKGFALEALSVTSGYVLHLPWFHTFSIAEDLYIRSGQAGQDGVLIGASFQSLVKNVMVDCQAGATQALSKVPSSYGRYGIRIRNGRDTLTETEDGIGADADGLEGAEEGGQGGMTHFLNVTVRNYQYGFQTGGLYYGRHKQDFTATGVNTGTRTFTIENQVETAGTGSIGSGITVKILRAEFAVPNSTALTFSGGGVFTLTSEIAVGDQEMTGNLATANLTAGETADYQGDFTGGFRPGHKVIAYQGTTRIAEYTVDSVAFSTTTTVTVDEDITAAASADTLRVLIAKRLADPRFQNCQAGDCDIGFEVGWLVEAPLFDHCFTEYVTDHSYRIARGCENAMILNPTCKVWKTTYSGGSVVRSWAITGVNTGTNTLTVTGTLDARIVAGATIEVVESTGNDAVYTVSAVSGQDITTVESITDATADGYVIGGPVWASYHINSGYDPESDDGKDVRGVRVIGGTFWQASFTGAAYLYGAGSHVAQMDGPIWVRTQVDSDEAGRTTIYLDGNHNRSIITRPQVFGTFFRNVVNGTTKPMVFHDAGHMYLNRETSFGSDVNFGSDGTETFTGTDGGFLLGDTTLQSATRIRYQHKSADFTISGIYSGTRTYYRIDAASGNVDVTLPEITATGTGPEKLVVMIKRVDTSGNTVTMNCAGSNEFDDGSTSKTIATGAWVIMVATFVSSQGTWDVLS